MEGMAGFSYEGKRTLLVGGSSGMGAATARLVAELGGEVLVADVTDDKPVDGATMIRLDLRDLDSIAAAIEACGGPVDALFSCAGISEAGLDIMLVNFIGQRELIERCVEGGVLARGSAVGMISSGAGAGWEHNLPLLLELIETSGFEAAKAWSAERPELCQYSFTKQLVSAYCARRALPFLQRGIRINALLPSSVDTPLARRSTGWLEYGTDYREVAGIEVAKPIDLAYPLAFLCSSAARYITGTTLRVDGGLDAARLTGMFVPQIPSVIRPSE